ncbi:MAG: cobalt ECF transporter T component CbiQ [Candidatus Baldrarchaeia archaeon]
MGLFPDFWLINEYAENGDSPLHRIHPIAKLVTVLAITVLVVITYNLETLVALLLLTFFLCLLTRASPRYFISWLSVPFLFGFSISIMLPFTVPGRALLSVDLLLFKVTLSIEGVMQGLIIILKVVTAALAIFMVVLTTSHFELLYYVQKAFPRTLSVMLLLTFRYVFLVIDEMKRMREAVGARGGSLIRTFFENIKLFGNILGAFLIRTMERAERVYTAMEVRGFDGTIRLLSPHKKFSATDMAFLVSSLSSLSLLLWITTEVEILAI